MDQDLGLRIPTTLSHTKVQTYYNMLGLPSDATKDQVKAKCDALAKLAVSTSSGTSEAVVNRRLVDEVCAALGFPRDPYPSIKGEGDTVSVDADSTERDLMKPTKEELEAWGALMPLLDLENKDDEAVGIPSRAKDRTATAYLFEMPNALVEKTDQKDLKTDPVAALVERFSKRRSPAFENWRRLRRVLDAFPEMSHDQLSAAHRNILIRAGSGYGRQQVDSVLVSEAWDILGNYQSRRQYHLRLGLGHLPKYGVDNRALLADRGDHEGDTTEEDTESATIEGGSGDTQHKEVNHKDHTTNVGAKPQDSNSDDGSRVVQDPNILLDDPFTEKQGPPKHAKKAQGPITPVKSFSLLPPTRSFRNESFSRPIMVVRSPGLPPMGTWQCKVNKPSAATTPTTTSANADWSQPRLPETPGTFRRRPAGQEVIDTPTRIIGWVNSSAKRARDDQEIVDTPTRTTGWTPIHSPASRARDDDTESEIEVRAPSGRTRWAPRCQRCGKNKKGCDRQRPCQRCKEAGIGVEGCVSEDEGSGRKGRFGRQRSIVPRPLIMESIEKY
ncbi:MAG: hypothetical protein Q9226_008343 [Calogaya cf. arnoldii]